MVGLYSGFVFFLHVGYRLLVDCDSEWIFMDFEFQAGGRYGFAAAVFTAPYISCRSVFASVFCFSRALLGLGLFATGVAHHLLI